MSKGKHKGGYIYFTYFDKLQQKLKEQKEEQQKLKELKEEFWMAIEEERKKTAESASEEKEGDENKKPKAKNVSGLIEIENPKHVIQKMKKLTMLDSPAPAAAENSSKYQLSKEEIERQREDANYLRLHALGMTEEAKAYYEKLARIRKHNEKAQKLREKEKRGKYKGGERSFSNFDEFQQPKLKKQNKKEWGRRKILPTLQCPALGAAANSSGQLSRKEREEVERQRAADNYHRLHAQGKTDEAKADLERLALIRKQREEAQKLREEEKKAKEDAVAAKKERVAKILNKKRTK